jgi:hypothetical protein
MMYSQVHPKQKLQFIFTPGNAEELVSSLRYKIPYKFE